MDLRNLVTEEDWRLAEFNFNNAIHEVEIIFQHFPLLEPQFTCVKETILSIRQVLQLPREERNCVTFHLLHVILFNQMNEALAFIRSRC
jgi:ABC-type polar amino acid transport system ATPase subunit